MPSFQSGLRLSVMLGGRNSVYATEGTAKSAVQDAVESSRNGT